MIVWLLYGTCCLVVGFLAGAVFIYSGLKRVLLANGIKLTLRKDGL